MSYQVDTDGRKYCEHDITLGTCQLCHERLKLLLLTEEKRVFDLTGELNKFKEAMSEKLTEDQSYCMEFCAVVILKQKLYDRDKEVELLKALLKICNSSCALGIEALKQKEEIIKRLRGN